MRPLSCLHLNLEERRSLNQPLIKSGRVEIITKLVLVYGLQVVVSSLGLIMALQMI